MGNRVSNLCDDYSSENNLQIKIKYLIEENNKLKNELNIIKNNKLDIIEDELKVSVKSLVNELMKNDNINLDLIPDFVEKKIYENVLTLAISLLKETLEKTKITILNQDITFNIEPSK